MGYSLRTVIVLLSLWLGGVLLLRSLGRIAPVLLLGGGGLVAGQQLGGFMGVGDWPSLGDAFAVGATLVVSSLLALAARRGTQRLEAWPGGTRWNPRPAPEAR